MTTNYRDMVKPKATIEVTIIGVDNKEGRLLVETKNGTVLCVDAENVTVPEVL